MRGIGRHLQQRSADEEVLAAERRGHAPDRQFELIDREEAGAVEADERAASLDELIERANAQLIRRRPGRCRLRSARRCGGSPRSGRRAASSAAGSLEDRAVVRENEHVELVAERSGLDVGRRDPRELEAVLLEDPARPPFVHARVGRTRQRDARTTDRDAGGGGSLGGQREGPDELILIGFRQPRDQIPRRRVRRAGQEPDLEPGAPRAVDRPKRVVLCGAHRERRTRFADAPGRRHDRRRDRIRVEPDPRDAIERGGIVFPGYVRHRFRFEFDGRAEPFHGRPRVGAEQRRDRNDLDAHREGQRPTRGVVRLVERAVRRFANLRVLLDVEHFARQRREFLVGGNDPGACRVTRVLDRRRRRELRDADASERQAPQQLDRGHRIALLLRNHVRVRRFTAALEDLIAAGLVAIEEERVLVSRRVVEHGQRGGMHVLDRVAQPPGAAQPGAGVQRLWAAHIRRDLIGCRGSRRRARALCFGPERRDVLEHRQVVDIARIPRVVARTHVRRADLAALLQPLRDRHPDHVHFARQQVRRMGRDRLRERREPDPRREWRGLVMDINDVGFPQPPGVLERPRLDHVEHVGVPVVVVANIFLIQLRHRRDGRVGRRRVLHLPLRHHLMTVGVDGRPEHQNDVVEDRAHRRLLGGTHDGFEQ